MKNKGSTVIQIIRLKKLINSLRGRSLNISESILELRFTMISYCVLLTLPLFSFLFWVCHFFIQVPGNIYSLGRKESPLG